MPVEFNDENKASVLYAKFQSSNQQPALVRWLMSSGVVKTAAQANTFLVVLVIAIFAVSGFIFYQSNGGGGSSKLTPAQIQVMEQAMNHAPSTQ